MLIALLVVQSFSASLRKSPVFDEPAHIAAGLSYLATGVFAANAQHPPLLKELAAVSLRMAGVGWPAAGPPGAGMEWPIGNAIIAQNGPDRVLFWARLPFILLTALLGFLVYWWGRQLAGDLAALGALFLLALDPTIVAHSSLVATDVGFAAFTVLFLYALWRQLQKPGWKSVLFAGVALGLVLCTKFSAVALLPVAAILMLASGRKPADCAKEFAGMCLAAAVVIDVLYFSPAGILHYVEGTRRVNADHNADYLVFLAGELRPRFTYYFPAVWLLKEPIAALVSAAIGLFALRRLSKLARLFLIVPAAVLFAGYLFAADDFGVRYLIPIFVFAYLIGGVGLAALIGSGVRWKRGLAAVLCGWMALAAIGIYPDHLSYFNEAACVLDRPGSIGLDGGARCGTLWLDDSNVDWGQGLKQLNSWLDANGRGRTVRLAYFGTFPAAAYGIQAQVVNAAALLQPPVSGLYAVSAHLVARMPAFADRTPGASDWLRRTVPTAIVGHAYYIYEIPAY